MIHAECMTLCASEYYCLKIARELQCKREQPRAILLLFQYMLHFVSVKLNYSVYIAIIEVHCEFDSCWQ